MSPLPSAAPRPRGSFPAAAAVLGAVVLVVLWPRLSSPAPVLPDARPVAVPVAQRGTSGAPAPAEAQHAPAATATEPAVAAARAVAPRAHPATAARRTRRRRGGRRPRGKPDRAAPTTAPVPVPTLVAPVASPWSARSVHRQDHEVLP